MGELSLHFWVEDLVRSMRFYTEALGFTVKNAEPADSPVFYSLLRGDAGVMLSTFGAFESVWPLDREAVARRGGQAPSTAYIESKDLDADFARAVAAGATVIDPPAERPWNQRDFVVADPDGFWWTVWQGPPGWKEEQARE
jgi:uncharacterized glyoxalase superfamily protein PhnB